MITATIPFDYVPSTDPDIADRQLAKFMERAQKKGHT